MQSSRTKVYNYFEISTRHPLKYIMDGSILIVLIIWENPSDYKGLIHLCRIQLCQEMVFLNPTDGTVGSMKKTRYPHCLRLVLVKPW